MELLQKRGFELIPKRRDDEPAAEIDVPFELDLDDGDRISATITKSGTVKIRAVEPEKMFVLGTVIIDGFAPEQAQAIAKGFWGRVWAAHQVGRPGRAGRDHVRRRPVSRHVQG